MILEKTYVFYDGPRVFLTSSGGREFIGVSIDETGTEDTSLYIPVIPKIREEVELGLLSLYDAALIQERILHDVYNWVGDTHTLSWVHVDDLDFGARPTDEPFVMADLKEYTEIVPTGVHYDFLPTL